MADAIQQVAEPRAGQEALVCGSVRLTYGQLLERIHALAQGLYNLGLRKGDKVAIVLPAGAEFVLSFFAVAELGGVVVPLNPQLRQRALNDVLGDAQPSALLTSRALGDERISLVPQVRHVIWADDGPGLSLAQVMAPAGSAPPPADVYPEDLLALVYTSGTTGKPKGAMHAHRGLIAPVLASVKLRDLWIRRPSLRTAVQTARSLARYGRRLLRAAGRPQTFLSTVSWHTITGLEVMLQALLMGDRLVVMPRFHPREALELVEQERVTILIAVPMAYQVMLGLPELGRYDTSSLLICATGAAPCPPHLARDIQHRFGCAVHIGFGATETAGGIAATSLADSSRRQAETVGRPMPGMEIKVVDEQRRELPPGAVGELACRSDSIMLGYYGAPEVTAEVIDEQNWYYTGDLAVIDKNGYLRIVGRKRDVIIRGGQNIYPAEVEAFLTAHPKICDAAVVGVPAKMGGESVWAFVILQEEAEMTAQEVLDYCRAELEPYKIPSQVRFLREFPQALAGKSQKFKLRELALQELQASV